MHNTWLRPCIQIEAPVVDPTDKALCVGSTYCQREPLTKVYQNKLKKKLKTNTFTQPTQIVIGLNERVKNKYFDLRMNNTTTQYIHL